MTPALALTAGVLVIAIWLFNCLNMLRLGTRGMGGPFRPSA